MVDRILIHMYEEQSACVKISDHTSASFGGITNGTIQGSALFSVYLDELLGQLRQLEV